MTTVLLAGGGSGGHLMPALAIADATRALRPEWRFVFAGAERGIESRVLPERGLPHRLLRMEPLYRQQWWKNLRWPLLVGPLVRSIDAMLQDESPAVVIGTGGYVSGPVLWRASRRGIPTGILELDVRPGIATRMLAARVNEVWLGAPEARSGLPSAVRGRATVTGAPIIPPDPARRDDAMHRFGLTGERRVLVITGGSQGSLAINRVVAAWVRGGAAADFDIIWATGRGSYDEFSALNAPPHLQVVPFLDPMADAWSVADACVARAGMMTLAELSAWGIPSVLIPLPTAAADHQTYNADAMAAAGAATVLEQRTLDVASLARAVGGLLRNEPVRAAMSAAARTRGKPDAANAIAARVVGLAERPA